MRCRLTPDLQDEVNFSLYHPLHSLADYDTRREQFLKKLNSSSSAGESYFLLGELEVNSRIGCCSLDRRMAEVLLSEMIDGMTNGLIKDPASRFLHNDYKN